MLNGHQEATDTQFYPQEHHTQVRNADCSIVYR